jgi:hydrogenase/urease accessory protein HupE
VLGAVVAAGLRLRGWAAALAVAIGGVTAGAAGGFQTATWEEVVGGGMLLGLIVVTWLLLASRVVLPARIVRGATLARRMAGAWIAAVGILLVALWLRGVG